MVIDTPLHLAAAYHDSKALVSALVRKGAGVRATNAFGE